MNPISEHEKQSREICPRGICSRGLSWSAIIAGAFVAIGLSFLLNLFDIGIGLSAYSTTTTEKGARALAFGGYIAMVIGVMVAMFVAGWVSGFIAKPKCTSGCHGVLYGFLTWCLALILSFILLGQATQFVSHQYRALSNSNATHLSVTTAASLPAGAAKASVEVTDEKAAKALAESIFLVFILFFAGAVSASFGGYVAVKRCTECKVDDMKTRG